jgi:sortase A
MRITLNRVNTCLLILIIIIDAYIIGAPLFPKLTYWWQTNHTHARQNLTEKLRPRPASKPSATTADQPNSLVVPAMLLDTPVLEGPVKNTYKILDKGIWRWPLGSAPDKGGNTILIGHRFTYTNPKGIFYALDKVKVGDEIGVMWDNQHYLYKVITVKTVPPSDTSILSPTSDAQLTMYTCTPLWNPVNRLVVVAKLEQS